MSCYTQLLSVPHSGNLPDILHRVTPPARCLLYIKRGAAARLRVACMSSQSASDVLFARPATTGKLIALILNYTLPTQVNQLLRKGTSAWHRSTSHVASKSASVGPLCRSGLVHMRWWGSKSAVRCCTRLLSAIVGLRCSQTVQTSSHCWWSWLHQLWCQGLLPIPGHQSGRSVTWSGHDWLAEVPQWAETWAQPWTACRQQDYSCRSAYSARNFFLTCEEASHAISFQVALVADWTTLSVP